jgi:large repetitive protein
VLANDTDPDGGPKTIQSVTQPAKGSVAITGGGSGPTSPALPATT